jgi:hypothetical protein
MKPWLNYVKILAELELMKERFAKLLLGEDMSGSGKGVSTAVTISNAITNLYGNIFCNELGRLMGKEINMLIFSYFLI